ncbi:MAG: phosphonate metabolism protein/1,5-bisphosphokinase (PRPP-forming) PhnN [Pseudomonadota bacterium]
MRTDKRSNGVLFVITGPSGSGKDTLINWLRPHFHDGPDMMFVRRAITRDDGGNEEHECVSAETFAARNKAGGYAVTWDAHGLSYGIPAEVLSHTHRGGHAVMNGSRRALPRIADVFAELQVINLRVSNDVLAARLSQRGRESAEEISTRLARAAGTIPTGIMVTEVDNSGALEVAGHAVLDVISARLSLERDQRASADQ